MSVNRFDYLVRYVFVLLPVLSMMACNPSAEDTHAQVTGTQAQPTSEPAPGGPKDPRAIYLDDSGGEDWPGFGRSYGEQHFSPLTQINEQSVSGLGLAWYMDLEHKGNSVTQPIAVDGVLYFAAGLSIVHAVDVRSGKLLWKFDPRAGERADRGLRWFWGTRGIAWWNGKVYVGTVDGRLIAIDAGTGKEVWAAQVTEPGSGLYLAGAPRAADGKIIIGEANGDYIRHRGYADAYDAETGKRLWRFYIVPGNPADGFENSAMEMAAKTWTGEWWKWGPGGNPWNAFAYDPDTNTVMIGTSDGFPFNQRIRSPGGGDNLFICSMVAVDADTGEYKWHYQFVPGDTWDYDSTMDIELADLVIDGKQRKVAMMAPKNGFFYVIDRTSGELISAEKIARVTWASHIDMATGRPVEMPGARYPDGQSFELWPSMRGAHTWPPMAFSPQTQLVYIPKFESGLTYDDRGLDKDNIAQWGINISAAKPDPLNNTSSLLAWDPVTQKKTWEVPTYGGWASGIMATAGGLVFQGQINGQFSAYSALEGRELWAFSSQAPIIAAPITYSVDGRQYVSVLVGMGYSAAAEVFSHKGLEISANQQRRVLTFTLDGKAALPAPPAKQSVLPVQDPDYKAEPDLAAEGDAIFARDCAYCHGQLAISGGYAPDLRASAAILSYEAFEHITRSGLLVATGMPKWDDLSDADVRALRQYLRSRAADMRADAVTSKADDDAAKR